MSMHKSFRTDTKAPAGQVVAPQGAPVLLQGKTLQKEIEDYQLAMKSCRCNDECVNLCEQCPNRTQENTNCR